MCPPWEGKLPSPLFYLRPPLPIHPTTLLHHNLIKLRVPSKKPELALHWIHLHRASFVWIFRFPSTSRSSAHPPSSTVFWCFSSLVFCGSLVLDLLTSIPYYKTCSSATGSPASLEFAGGLFCLRRHLNVGACFPCARLLFHSTGAWSYHLLSPPFSASTSDGPK